MKLLLMHNRLDFVTILSTSCDDILDFFYPSRLSGTKSLTKNHQMLSDSK
jgi:hypothetical protein